jgi:hypothetical protein
MVNHMCAQTFGLRLDDDKVSRMVISKCEWKVREIVSMEGEDSIGGAQTFENRKKVQKLV